MIDLEENLIYRRLPLKTSPAGGFAYVLHIPDTNYVEWGLGWESANALQRKHVATETVHELNCYDESNKFAWGRMVKFKVGGSLSEIFAGWAEAEEVIISDAHPSPDGDLAAHTKTTNVSQWLAEAIREVHDEAWGNPAAWEPDIVSLGDGRCVWAMYDDDADRIRVGIGMYDEANEPVLGDNSYIIGKDFAAEFVVKVYQGQALFFFSVPPRYPHEFDKVVDNYANLKTLAKAVLSLADKVWPGEIDAFLEE